MRAALLATLVSILGACGSESAPPVPAAGGRADAALAERPAEGPLVAFLGDSLAAGLHLAADEAFPAVLQRRLVESGQPFRLVNAGVSGDTSAGGLRRVDWILAQEPDLVVIELGANDGLRGLPLESIEANLRAIVARVHAAGAEILLLGMLLPPNYGQDYAAGFTAVYARVAAEHDVAFVPSFLEGVGGVAELNLPDGIHPTAEGHRRLADNVEASLRAILEEH